jgi:hypothetical protein
MVFQLLGGLGQTSVTESYSRNCPSRSEGGLFSRLLRLFPHCNRHSHRRDILERGSFEHLEICPRHRPPQPCRFFLRFFLLFFPLLSRLPARHVLAARKGLDDTRRLVLTRTLVAQASLRVDLTSHPVLPVTRRLDGRLPGGLYRAWEAGSLGFYTRSYCSAAAPRRQTGDQQREACAERFWRRVSAILLLKDSWNSCLRTWTHS